MKKSFYQLLLHTVNKSFECKQLCKAVLVEWATASLKDILQRKLLLQHALSKA